MYCSKCGTLNIDSAVFCHNCGAKMSTVVAPTVSPEAESTVSADTEQGLNEAMPIDDIEAAYATATYQPVSRVKEMFASKLFLVVAILTSVYAGTDLIYKFIDFIRDVVSGVLSGEVSFSSGVSVSSFALIAGFIVSCWLLYSSAKKQAVMSRAGFTVLKISTILSGAAVGIIGAVIGFMLFITFIMAVVMGQSIFTELALDEATLETFNNFGLNVSVMLIIFVCIIGMILCAAVIAFAVLFTISAVKTVIKLENGEATGVQQPASVFVIISMFIFAGICAIACLFGNFALGTAAAALIISGILLLKYNKAIKEATV